MLCMSAKTASRTGDGDFCDYYTNLLCSASFTKAIEIDPTNHVLYSNRSGAYASKKDFDLALEDANKVTEINPAWSKGWGRKGTALHGQGDLRE
jgi:tetratricopeptide (TPR) repeat protein